MAPTLRSCDSPMADRLRRARRTRQLGAAATVWAWLFAAAHVYWAVGGRVGLTAQTVASPVVADPSTYVLGWTLSVYLFVALGLFPLTLVWPTGRRDPRQLHWAAITAGYAGMLGLILYGIRSSDAAGLIVLGSGVSVAGAIVGMVRPATQPAGRWMVLVATLALGGGMLVYGVAYLVAAALSGDAQTRWVYALTGGVSWTGEGVLFVATGWLARHGQVVPANVSHR